MFDYELFAPDAPTMESLLTQMSIKQANSGKVNGTIYATDYYGTKYLATGATTTGLGGLIISVMAAQPGVYCNLRWMGTTGLALNQQQINAGCVLKLITAPFYRVFAPTG